MNNLNNNDKKSIFLRIFDYAFYPVGKSVLKCFLASICFFWCIVAIFSFVLALPSLITGDNYIKAAVIIGLIFGGSALVYPFVGAVLHGHEDSFAYSAGFYYGTLLLTALLRKVEFSSDEALFVSAIISALACWIIFLKRKNNK